MSDDRFQTLDRMLAQGESAESLDFLIEMFRQDRNYPALFEARLMKCRLVLGLPVIQTEDSSAMPAESRRRYEHTVVEAAREVGDAYLGEGDIERAWPYYRAIGEIAPIAAAIDGVQPAEGIEGIIGIAFQEGVHPVKGLELILAQHGMCRAITSFGMYAVEKGRQECIGLLVRSLHAEIVERMKRAIAHVEGAAPDQNDLPSLMAGREWLFGEYDYYVDTSHLTSLVQYAPEMTDDATLRLTHELCEYGRRLSSQFQHQGYPPFENTFTDYGKYLEALLGIGTDEAIGHFRKKAEEAESETLPAQVLVKLLVRMGRHAEALEAALEHLQEASRADLSCPSPLQICQMAGDYNRLMSLARTKGDLLSYAAAGLERQKEANAAAI